MVQGKTTFSYLKNCEEQHKETDKEQLWDDPKLQCSANNKDGRNNNTNATLDVSHYTGETKRKSLPLIWSTYLHTLILLLVLLLASPPSSLKNKRRKYLGRRHEERCIIKYSEVLFQNPNIHSKKKSLFLVSELKNSCP